MLPLLSIYLHSTALARSHYHLPRSHTRSPSPCYTGPPMHHEHALRQSTGQDYPSPFVKGLLASVGMLSFCFAPLLRFLPGPTRCRAVLPLPARLAGYEILERSEALTCVAHAACPG